MRVEIFIPLNRAYLLCIQGNQWNTARPSFWLFFLEVFESINTKDQMIAITSLRTINPADDVISEQCVCIEEVESIAVKALSFTVS